MTACRRSLVRLSPAAGPAPSQGGSLLPPLWQLLLSAAGQPLLPDQEKRRPPATTRRGCVAIAFSQLRMLKSGKLEADGRCGETSKGIKVEGRQSMVVVVRGGRVQVCDDGELPSRFL